MLKDLKINKNDMIILSIILVISILTKISTFYYPIGGDTVVYLNLAEEINNNLSYNLNNIEHIKFPPGWPFFLQPFLTIFGNPIVAVKIAGILVSSLIIALTYGISRKLNITQKESILISALLLFNPWFFYSSLLYLGASLFFIIAYKNGHLITKSNDKLRKRNNLFHYLVGIFLSFSWLTRVDMLFYIIPFMIYYGWDLVINRKNIFRNILVVILTGLPFFLWTLRGILISSSVSGYDYVLKYDANNILLSIKTIFLAITFSSALLLPFMCIGMFFLIKKNNNKIWLILLSGLAIHMIFFIITDTRFEILGSLIFTIMRTRRLVIALPLLTIAVYLGLNYLKKYNKSLFHILKTVLLIYIPITIVMTLVINNGMIQERTNDVIDLGDTFTVRSYHRQQANDWINKHSATDSIVLGDFDEQMKFWYVGSYLRKDLSYYDLNEENYSNLSINDLTSSKIYLISEKPSRLNDISFSYSVIFKEVINFDTISIYESINH